MDSRVPRVVVFDLGKVLLDFDYFIAAQALSPLSRLAATDFKRVLDQSPLLHEFETGALSNQEFYTEVQRLTGYQGNYDQFAAAFGDIFTEIPPMVALHQDLKTKGVTTWAFSNTNDLAIGHIRRQFPFYGDFAGTVLSHEIGAMKPNSASYEAIEAATGFRGSELLYLDDRPENIEGAQRRGWQTIHHTDPMDSIKRVWAALGLN
ncbi:MAG TPA: HAD family phosphatase [Verrucomicrobiota bacterium]|nr:HAD family phosphatase [Verrucomicrobiota bacterium]